MLELNEEKGGKWKDEVLSETRRSKRTKKFDHMAYTYLNG